MCVLPLGYELLFQPEVVRIYTSLLRESKNPSVLEAAAGAIQNLCAGRWTVSVAFWQTAAKAHRNMVTIVHSVASSY